MSSRDNTVTTNPLSVSCPDVDATRRAAAALAPHLKVGDVILLEGDLGAGKTTFTQALARALGVDESVTSPTFTLVHSYPTAAGFDLYHVDLYRLERRSEVVDLGLAELLEDGGVAVVEWGDRSAGVFGPDVLHISLSGQGDDTRDLRVGPAGDSWTRRWDDLTAAMTGATT